ncbi:MAG: thiolase family protein [Rhodospirillales bacterium]|nr:thiolase family protein [Rhodospirillales bacterium]
MKPMIPASAIVGVGRTPQGTLPGSTALGLQIAAAKAALADSGLDKSEIDGLLTQPGTTAPEGIHNYLRLGEALGLSLRYGGSFAMGGATCLASLQMASHAVASGAARAVLCVFGDAARTGGSKFDRAAGWGDSWGIWGMFSAAANSAMTARRHMHEFGTESRHLGEVAIACRRHASLNPDAVMRTPMTLEQHLASRLIVDPLRLYDCCLISDGGVAFIVTTRERARDLRQRPVRVMGAAQAHSPETIGNPQWWYMPHQRVAIEQVYAQAGVSPADIDFGQIYDNFTISVIIWLEQAGFCGRGEGGPFVEGGRIQLGGELPVNTAGGNLSESYMQGWLHLVEAVRQLRGECGARQVADAEIGLVTGRGMTLNCSAAAVLGRE